ncbi:MAG: hypothetical protein ACOYYF_07885 [Chloroflexota bacterium]|nr:hypothetical protein [Chloroflexota bacterium]
MDKAHNMYYVFSPVLRTRNNEIVQAKLVGSSPRIVPHWWEATPLTATLPLLTFTVKREWSLPDNLFTGTIFDLYSIGLIEVLVHAGIDFETFPAVVTDKSGEDLNVRYEIFHLLEKRPCLDSEKSKTDDDALEIRKLVLSEEFMSLRKPMVRVEEVSEIVLVHKDLKNLIEKKGITGCNFTPVSKYQSGLRFYFRNQKGKPTESS